MKGLTWNFTTVTPAPSIEEFMSVVTTTELLPAEMSAIIVDLDNNVTSSEFSANDPNIELTPGETLYAPTLDVKLAPEGVQGTYEITLTVMDESSNTVEATAEVQIYDDPCEAARNAPSWEGYNFWDRIGGPEGALRDCKVDIMDFAGMAAEWLNDRTLKSQENY